LTGMTSSSLHMQWPLTSQSLGRMYIKCFNYFFVGWNYSFTHRQY
jgi:hypothetical protein